MAQAFGSPQGALLFFSLFSTIGVVLGGIIYALTAYPNARRPQFRHWGTMPRTGAVIGLVVATVIVYMAWSSAYRSFYHLEVDAEHVRLQFYMPSQEVELPRSEIVAMKKRRILGRGGGYRIVLVTGEGGTFSSAKMYRPQFEEAWAKLLPYFPGA
jgi:hypothetical protein